MTLNLKPAVKIDVFRKIVLQKLTIVGVHNAYIYIYMYWTVHEYFYLE